MKKPIRAFLIINIFVFAFVITLLVIYAFLFAKDHNDLLYLTMIFFVVCLLLTLLLLIFLNRTINYIVKAAYKRVNENFDEIVTKPAEKNRPILFELHQIFTKIQNMLMREKRFTANAAHELKTPLAAMKTHAQVALNTDNEKERTKALKQIIRGVDRSDHAVQQLLILSRMSPDYIRKKFVDLDLKVEAKLAIIELVPLAREKNIDIELIASDNTNLIRGNKVAISIMLSNLIKNAILYGKDNGNIQVIVQETSKKVLLKVVDDGPGISKELRSQVFERFFRLPGSTDKGTGLGLNIVEQIAHAHDATIKLVTPKSGKGLEFTTIFNKAK